MALLHETWQPNSCTSFVVVVFFILLQCKNVFLQKKKACGYILPSTLFWVSTHRCTKPRTDFSTVLISSALCAVRSQEPWAKFSYVTHHRQGSWLLAGLHIPTYHLATFKDCPWNGNRVGKGWGSAAGNKQNGGVRFCVPGIFRAAVVRGAGGEEVSWDLQTRTGGSLRRWLYPNCTMIQCQNCL